MLLKTALLAFALLATRPADAAQVGSGPAVTPHRPPQAASLTRPAALPLARPSVAAAPLPASVEAQVREQEIRLLTQQARAAGASAREQQQRQRALTGVAWLLALGLVAGAAFYWRLRRNRAQLAKAHREISAAVAEKEVLVQEIHHRVKNNLQLVSSLLAWQSSRSNDPVLVDMLLGSQARIHSMALVHEFLYRADNLAQVRLDTYLAELLQTLCTSLNSARKPIELTADLDAVVMEAKDASAFGLLVNELVTNAYKHAFDQRPSGHLRVTLSRKKCPYGFQLRVIDNGVGLPEAGLLGKPESLGMQLVTSLAKQLKASVTATAHLPAGTCIEVTRA